MRYAILSDVHANEAALRAVLADARNLGADRVICLGDVVGYGPDPVSTFELVHDSADVCLKGNHDAAACGDYPLDCFIEDAARSIAEHRSQLPQKAIRWFRRCPLTYDGPGFACAHGDFASPGEFNYVIEPEDAMQSWQVRTEPLLFIGHSHRPGTFVLGLDREPYCQEPIDFTLADGKRYIVNVGSVGYPRSDELKSFYCIYDDVEKSVTFRSLPFDMDEYIRRMNALCAEGPALRRRRNLCRALAMGVLLALVFVGALGAFRLARGAADETDEPKSVAEAPAALALPMHSVMETDGCSVYVEDETRQKVEIVRNVKRNVTAFRITNDGLATVRFIRSLDLSDMPKRIHTAVELFTRAGKSYFSFTTRTEFFDASEKPVGRVRSFKGKLSSKKSIAVPKGAVRAMFTVECRSEDVHEMALPHLSAEPMQ